MFTVLASCASVVSYAGRNRSGASDPTHLDRVHDIVELSRRGAVLCGPAESASPCWLRDKRITNILKDRCACGDVDEAAAAGRRREALVMVTICVRRSMRPLPRDFGGTLTSPAQLRDDVDAVFRWRDGHVS
jgi:hypothetical protein